MFMFSSYKIEKSKVVGYKVVAELDGTYFSCMTGTIIKKGKVKILKPSFCANRISFYWNDSLDNAKFSDLFFHDDFLCGKTIIYKKRYLAEKLLSDMSNYKVKYNCKLTIVKITLKGSIYEASMYYSPFNNSECYLSDYISKIIKL